MNDKNDNTVKPISGVHPFTKYRAVETAVCGVCVILGILYLYAKVIPLAVLMPIYAVCFCAIPILQFLDIRASGRRGFINYVPAIFWGVISITVIVATVVYFAR